MKLQKANQSKFEMSKSLYSILFPTDFSTVSNQVLSDAIDLACRLDAQLYLFHAYQMPMAVTQGTGTFHPPLIDYEKIAYQNLRELERSFPDLQKVRYSMVTKPGPFPGAIEMLLETNSVDLIVMGTSGAEGLKELMIGTNTSDVANELNIPVLAIPEGASVSSIGKIAFAYDHEGIKDTDKLNILRDLVSAYNAELHILHISESMEPQQDANPKSLDAINKKFLNAKCYHDIHLSDDVEHGIMQYADNNSIDLIAVTPREHSFIEKLFRKSVTEKLTFHSDVPLLILKE